MIQLSNDLLDRIAPKLSALRPFKTVVVRDHGIPLVHLLLQIGWWEVDKTEGVIVFAVLRQMARRASAAFEAYSRMVESLDRLFADYVPDNPDLVAYFSALDAAEACLLNLQITCEVMNNSGFGREKWVSGPEIDACIKLANAVKHFGERRSGGRSGSIVPVWFEERALVDGKVGLDVADFAELVSELQNEVRYIATSTRASP